MVNRSLDELRRRELLPFAAAIDAGCRLIMTSHILLPQLDREHPATMSRIVLDDLLRRELGFSGVVVSDALDMAGASSAVGMAGAAVAALPAGCDLLCLGTENTDAQLADIEQAVRVRSPRAALRATGCQDAAEPGASAGSRIYKPRGRRPGSLRISYRAGGWNARPNWSDTFDLQPGASDWRTQGIRRIRRRTPRGRTPISLRATYRGAHA